MDGTAKPWWHYYWVSALVAVLGVLGGGLVWGAAAALTIAVLTVLETSLSLDNAVVNAKILENWDERWRKIFLFWGIIIAVFGMRLLFPILIVMFTTGMGFGQTISMALHQPEQYGHSLEAAHYRISGFGGAFLAMVALGFFFAEKHVYWLEWAETKLTRMGQIEGVAAALVLGALFLLQRWVPAANQTEFLTSGVLGVVTFILAHGLGSLVGGEDEDEGDGAGQKVVRAGAWGFVYIEILDASFSFDGVIGAFALTYYLPIIMVGLGSGAFFVRSFTVHLVETGKLAEFRYLEHGAFYAIAVLAAIMLMPWVHLPEWVVGLSGATILGVALLHSVLHNRKHAAAMALPPVDRMQAGHNAA